MTSGVGCQDTSAGGVSRVRMRVTPPPLAHEGVISGHWQCCYPFQPPRVLGFLVGRKPELSSQLIKVERGAISFTKWLLFVGGIIFPNLCTGTSGSLFMFLKSNKEFMNFWGLD